MLEHIILGILQGIFEWLPVSSEGILALAANFLIKDLNPVEVALFLHLGTLFAVLIYFKKDWIKVAKVKDKKLIRFLTITTIISLTIGYFLLDSIKDIAFGSTLLAIMGLGLLLTSYFHSTKKSFNLKQDNLAIIAGILQGLAVIPGVSRSGSTIFGLSLGKLKPQEILRLSYMMSAPVVLAASIFLAMNNPVLIETWPALVVSFIIGFLTLKYLMDFSKRINFTKFTLAFGVLCLLGAVVGFLV